jgi:hypothetical protein
MASYPGFVVQANLHRGLPTFRHCSPHKISWLFTGHTGLLPLPQTNQALPYHRTFTLVVPSVWSFLLILHFAGSFSLSP